jgi:kumamolisin
MRSHLIGLFTAALAFTAIGAMASPATQRVPLAGHVQAGIATGALRALPESRSKHVDAAPLALSVVLRRNDREGFEQRLAAIYDRTSPEYGQYPTPEQVSDRYGPSRADYQIVRDFFTAQGFVALEDSSNRLTLRLLGSEVQVETALALQLQHYQSGTRVFRANDREPSLPPEIAARVEAIQGLNELATPDRLNATFRSLDRCMRNAEGIYTPDLQLACTLVYALDAALYDIACAFIVVAIQLDLGLTTGIGAAAVGGVVNRITGCHFVYPGGPVKTAGGHEIGKGPTPAAPGTGQKVGIVAFDTYVQSDVQNWLSLVGFAPGQIGKLSEVKISGGAALGADQDEVLLDIAQVMFLSPGAEVVVYSMPFGLGSYQTMFNRMLTDGVDIVSNSWSYCEDQTSLADVNSLDSVLASMAISGVTVLNASGDTGSTCLNGSPNTVGVPAGSPRATAVGGSSYTPGPAPLYGNERWWDGSTSNPPVGQGGYGTSRFFARPNYQNGFTSAPFRSVPDVVAAADPVTNGKPICQASKGGCPSGLFYGGTSVAAPLWAAIIANLNSGLNRNLGFLNPQLYPLAGTAALHGASELSSDFAHVGLGSPNVAQLYLQLSGTTLGPVDATRSAVVTNPAEVAADGSSSATVLVQLRDNRGLPVPGKTVSLTVPAGSSAVIAPATAVTSTSNGAVQFAVRNAVVGDVTVTARNVSDDLALGTSQVKFIPPPATAGSIAAFPTTVAANGTSSSTITVTLQDARGMPAIGKRIALDAGGARAIVAGPSPPITNAMGQVQFTARNRTAESVSFTAVDLSDGDLAVPGSATVTFQNATNPSCAVVPLAAPGWTVTPYLTGFPAGDFFFGGVQWSGCPGASNPTFDTRGSVYSANFSTGEVFRLGLAGGAATSPLANAGLTTGQPVFAEDGRLFAARGATTGGSRSGAIIELDPNTGNTLRTVASNLTCPSGLAVDPASGDLFFGNQCFGAGLDDASIFRLTDPSDTDPMRPTAVLVYATLPAAPTGALAFAPDGTLFAAGGYTNPSVQQAYRITGTAAAQPPTVAAVSGVRTIYWINVAEITPAGAAKSLIVLGNVDPFPLQLVDLSVMPATVVPLTTNGTSSGTIGPDGCIYTAASDTVYRIAPVSGPCRFNATNPSAALSLSPPALTPNPAQGGSVTLVAQLQNTTPVAGQVAVFQSLGANVALRLVPFDANGRAEYLHQGLAAGTDTIHARTVRGDTELLSNPARVIWGAGSHPTAVDLGFSTARGRDGRAALLRARLMDLSARPPTSVAGATLNFDLGGVTCSAVTDAGGIASCTVPLPAVGEYNLQASYAGGSALLPSSDQRRFFVTDDTIADAMFLDGYE